MTIVISSPPKDLNVVNGQQLSVTGIVTCGTAEQEDVPTVTVQLDTGLSVSAQVSPLVFPHSQVCFASYASEPLTMPSAAGAHVITVTASYKRSSAEAQVTVLVEIVGIPSSLKGTCSLKSALSVASPVQIEWRWNTSEFPVEIPGSGFPEIAFPSIPLLGGITLDMSMSLLDRRIVGSWGYYGAGEIDLQPAKFGLTATLTVPMPPPFGSIVIPATSQFTTFMTTEQSIYTDAGPPLFNDTGAEFQRPSGTVQLVGDGKFSPPLFGMTDFGITISGVLSPLPPPV